MLKLVKLFHEYMYADVSMNLQRPLALVFRVRDERLVDAADCNVAAFDALPS